MTKSVVPRLNDILQNIDLIRQWVAGKSAGDLEADRLLRLVIERAIEIVSEATRHIPARAGSRQAPGNSLDEDRRDRQQASA